MEDDLLIDENGSPSAPSAAARTRLARTAGGWKLLVTSPELLLGLRERADGLIDELGHLRPEGAVLAGDLGEMQPSDLLNFLHQGRRTGVLLTRSDGVERALVLLEGNVAWACSTSPGERLGELLCRSGLARRDRVEAALAEQGATAQHRRIGNILVEHGVIDAETLSRGLRHQTVEIFLGILVARSGSFVFLRGIERDALPAALNLDTQGLLLDGLRRLDEMELYRTLVPGLAARPRRTRKPLPSTEAWEAEGLGAEAHQLHPLCDGARSLAELAAATALGDFEATKATYRLVAAGYLEIV